jgi:predicted TIM-barrel fold metal-dependent hydrolase
MKKIEAVDAHHHLWDLEENNYPWLDPNQKAELLPNFADLCRDYRVEDYRSDCANQNIVKSVHVQAEHDESDPVRETAWLQKVADDPSSGGFPHAIVAYADLSKPGVESVLQRHREFANLRGIRQMLNHDPRAEAEGSESEILLSHGNLLEHEGWLRNFSLLRRYDLSFDMQLFPWQTDAAVKLISNHSDTQIILNHALMPVDRSEEGLSLWRRSLETYAGLPNVAIKISGLGMAEGGWNEAMSRRLASETLEIFGPERCLFASNFPVDRLTSDYDTIWTLFREIVAPLSEAEQHAILRGNAERIYRI